MRLTKNGAIGAAYLGAKATGYILPLDYKNNVDIFFHSELWILFIQFQKIFFFLNLQN